jgi:hypothetical protein
VALAEGAAILLLLPLLGVIGISGSSEAPTLSLEIALAVYLAVVVGAALLARQRAIEAARLRLFFADGLRLDLHQAVLTMEWVELQRLRSADVTQTIINEVARAGWRSRWCRGSSRAASSSWYCWSSPSASRRR